MGEKAAVLKLLEQLPEETTLEEIQYHLYVLQKIKRVKLLLMPAA